IHVSIPSEVMVPRSFEKEAGMAFEELKERQGVVWGSAPFENVAGSLADVHGAMVRAMQPAEGKRWLEVACGTGELATVAARRGASVVGIDLAPALIKTARRQAADDGVEIDYRVCDAENLELEDASFDAVTSTFGVMFAPDQPRAAAELARVTRGGGPPRAGTAEADDRRRGGPGGPRGRLRGAAEPCSGCWPRPSRRFPTARERRSTGAGPNTWSSCSETRSSSPSTSGSRRWSSRAPTSTGRSSPRTSDRCRRCSGRSTTLAAKSSAVTG